MKTGMPVVAVFDIGKTHKKFLLFDRDYQVVYKTEIRFESTIDEEGEPCENLPAIASWIKQTLDDTLYNQDFHIKALNFSAYGASLVNLDKRGTPVTPLYSYLKPFSADLLSNFYRKYGSRESIAFETSSPPLGMLNSGLQLYWLKHKKPDIFKKIKYSLHLPQYCSYLITNKAFSEMTSVGCHTALWDFRKKEYHAWVSQEDLVKLFPPIHPTYTKMDIPLGKHRFCAGIGIHDSSAALIPYLLTEKEPFLLLSTGTWSITFNPFNNEPLTAEELEKDCLAYMSPEGKPLKASRTFLGNEYNYYEKKIATFFGKDAAYHKQVKFDKQLVNKLLSQNNTRKKFLSQSTRLGAYLSYTKHKAVDLSLFESYEEAYHQLNIDLVAMQAMAIDTAIGNTFCQKLFITGNFCSNLIFVQLLASRFQQIEVYTASMSDASALGAALVMHNSWNEAKDIDTLFDFKRCYAIHDLGTLPYVLT